MIDSDGNMCLVIDSLIEINNIKTGSNVVNLRKVIVKPCEFDKIYLDRDLTDDNTHEIIN